MASLGNKIIIYRSRFFHRELIFTFFINAAVFAKIIKYLSQALYLLDDRKNFNFKKGEQGAKEKSVQTSQRSKSMETS